MAGRTCVITAVLTAVLMSTEAKLGGRKTKDSKGRLVTDKNRGIMHPKDKDFYHLKIVKGEGDQSKMSQLSTPGWMTEYEYEGASCGGSPVQQDSYLTNTCFAYTDAEGNTQDGNDQDTYGSVMYTCDACKILFFS